MNSDDDFLVAVLGAVGVGKSSFIKWIVQDDSIAINGALTMKHLIGRLFGYDPKRMVSAKRAAAWLGGDKDFEDVPADMQWYQTILPSGRKITLIDTPGFDDTRKTDHEILVEIKSFLSEAYGLDKKLSGLIYLHRITDLRFSVQGSPRLQRLWKILLGDDLSNLVLATTSWDALDAASCELKEKEIKELYWERMMEKGACIFRLYPNRGSALRLIDQLDLKRSTEFEYRGNLKVRSPSKRESQPSIYEHLDPGQIRLIDLLYGDGKEPVVVQLLDMPFDEKVEYETLSYSVGNPEKTAILSLRHHGRKEKLPVTGRLESILRYLRYPNKDRRLWVDAISVNQEDVEERAREVRRLGKIFAKAQNVCVWLGDSADDSDLAMDFVPEVLDFGAFDRLVRDDSKKLYWLALAKLMAREWFTRRWVVQEMALAQKATVHCGSRIISWPDMAAAIALFGTHWEEIVRRLTPLEAFMFGDVQTPGAASLVELSTKVVQRDQSGKIIQRRLGLEALLATLPMFDVTVPSDAIYSIIDVARDTYDANAISVDYGLEPAVLFSEVIDFIIKASGSMDIICRPWAPMCPNLPSYVSTISGYAFERRQGGQYYRHNADSLTGSPGRSFYRAAANTLPKHLMKTVSGRKTVECEGRSLGRIIATGGRSVNGNVPREWTKLVGWLDRSQPVPENFWRTLVADRGPGGTDPPSWYGNACKYAFTRARRDIDVSELLKTSNSSNERQFLRRVQATVWNRAFFAMQNSEDTVSFGLGPADTTSGDDVAVIFGCSVPVVLQEQGGLGISSFKLVGECFIHGYMDGEAVRNPGRNVGVTLQIV